MKRFLVFLLLFPAVATVSLYSVIYLLTGAVVDSVSRPALIYAIAIVPGLVVAMVDWLMSKTPIPTVVGTTLLAYGALVLFLAWDGSARYIFALGVISGLPAAVCSFLSREKAPPAPSPASI